MNEELLSAVIHTALHAWQAAPSPHAEIGERVASAAMHTEDGTIYVVTVAEVRPPAIATASRWPTGHLVHEGAAGGG